MQSKLLAVALLATTTLGVANAASTPAPAATATPTATAVASPADARALLVRGYAAYYGIGMTPDLAAAERLLRQAQVAGAPSALCMDWLWGVGFAADPAFAFECFRLAGARDWVAYMMAEGLGTKEDRAGAIAYLDGAAPAPVDLALPPVASDDPPRLVWSPQDHIDLKRLRERIAEGSTGSYYDPQFQLPSPCWYLADTTFGSVECVEGAEGVAARERTAIVERKIVGRFGPSVTAPLAAARKAWQALARADADLDAYLEVGDGTLSVQLAANDLSTAHDARSRHLEALLAGEWPQHHVDSVPAGETLAEMDKELNEAYRKVHRQLTAKNWPSEYGSAAEMLRDAQRAWIAYRDAEAALVQAIRGGDPAGAVAARTDLSTERAGDLEDVGEHARKAAAGEL